MSSGSDFGTEYESGKSIAQISARSGIPKSTVRNILLRTGVSLRTPAEGVRAARDRLGSGLRGKKRPPFTAEHRQRISEAKKAAQCKGVSIKPNGYAEHTRGPHKGRSVHVVVMEGIIGRRLTRGEVVHHLDGNKLNNAPSNLHLMSRADHTSLHRMERMVMVRHG